MDIQDRTLEFGVRVFRFAESLPKTQSAIVLMRQLIRSGTSVGANMEEADGAASKKDFVNKVVIARKEARETRYWLSLIQRANILVNANSLEELKKLIDESFELMRILSAIANKARE